MYKKHYMEWMRKRARRTWREKWGNEMIYHNLRTFKIIFKDVDAEG